MGKSRTQESVQNINQDLENEASNLFGILRSIAKMGYNPYKGNDVADFTPMQKTAMEAPNLAAAAFGMPTAEYGGPTGATDGGFSTYDVMMEQQPEAGALLKQIQGIFSDMSKKPDNVKQKKAGGGGKK